MNERMGRRGWLALSAVALSACASSNASMVRAPIQPVPCECDPVVELHTPNGARFAAELGVLLRASIEDARAHDCGLLLHSQCTYSGHELAVLAVDPWTIAMPGADPDSSVVAHARHVLAELDREEVYRRTWRGGCVLMKPLTRWKRVSLRASTN